MKRIIVVLTAVLFLAFSSAYLYAEEIKVGAGQAPNQNILKPIHDPFVKATGISLSVTPCGPKVALAELIKGNFEVALGGLAFEDWLAFMKKEGSEVKDPSALQHVVVGLDKIKVITNKANNISALSKDQLKGIFTGKITNWKDVGGADQPIIVVWTKLLGGNFVFTKMILDGQEPMKEVLEVNTSEDAKTAVTSNAEAIALAPLASVDAAVKAPETPEVGRPITLITIGKPSAKVQKLIDFIKNQGQQYIKK